MQNGHQMLLCRLILQRKIDTANNSKHILNNINNFPFTVGFSQAAGMTHALLQAQVHKEFQEGA